MSNISESFDFFEMHANTFFEKNGIQIRETKNDITATLMSIQMLPETCWIRINQPDICDIVIDFAVHQSQAMLQLRYVNGKSL